MLSWEKKCFCSLLCQMSMKPFNWFWKKLFLLQTVAVMLKTIHFCACTVPGWNCFNYKVERACILVDDVKKLSFDIHPINLYLHEKIKASSLYKFHCIKNDVIIRLDSIDSGHFFVSRASVDF